MKCIFDYPSAPLTPKKVYSVNTFGDYINRDKNKLEILAGLIKSNMK
ncbi:MAG: hypothetical protein E6415_07950 [Intestinibacter bartlettii]|nr:hypothetical protein [Intestinibacter bartlettii]MDU6823214.1 hypothetical protein [Intestinibacter bartlettii]